MSNHFLDLLRLKPLLGLTSGREDVIIALLDGPVATTHASLNGSNIRQMGGPSSAICEDMTSTVCRHGTFVAGVLAARRDTATPGICPRCTLLVRPIFFESRREDDYLPSTAPVELAHAIMECLEAGARVLNLSGAIPSSMILPGGVLADALREASRRGVLVVAAAGNQASVGCSTITGHPSVLPVVPYGRDGRPMAHANLGRAIGRHGVGAPGENVTSLDPEGGTVSMSGSSVAAPLVTGTVALLWSLVPTATAQEIRAAITQHERHQRKAITPPLLDAWAAYESLMQPNHRRIQHGWSGGVSPSRAPFTETSRAASPFHRR